MVERMYEGKHGLEIIKDDIRNRLSQTVGSLIVAVDGRSGTGKTTLAQSIAAEHSSILLHADDFCDGGTFAQWEAHSPQDRYKLSKNWQRLRHDALLPLREGRTATWQAYDWEADSLAAIPTVVNPRPLVIVEGVFSARPELKDVVDMSVMVDVADDERVQRIRNREGDAYMQSWFPIWEITENYYFNTVVGRQSFDIIYNNI